MTQQNQQNPGQQVLWVLLRVSQANLSKIQPGKAKAWKAGESSQKRTAAVMMMRLTGSSRLIKAQDEAVKEEHGKALPADLEQFILLAELSGGFGSGGVTVIVYALLIKPV